MSRTSPTMRARARLFSTAASLRCSATSSCSHSLGASPGTEERLARASRVSNPKGRRYRSRCTSRSPATRNELGRAGHRQLAAGGERGVLHQPDRDLVQLHRDLQLLGPEPAPADVAAAGNPAVVGLPLEVGPEDARLAEIELALQAPELERLTAHPEARIHQGGGADNLRVRRLAPRGALELEASGAPLERRDEGLDQPQVHPARDRDVHRLLLEEARGADLGLRAPGASAPRCSPVRRGTAGPTARRSRRGTRPAGAGGCPGAGALARTRPRRGCHSRSARRSPSR